MSNIITIENTEVVLVPQGSNTVTSAWIRNDTYERVLVNGDFIVISNKEDLALWANNQLGKDAKVVYLSETLSRYLPDTVRSTIKAQPLMFELFAETLSKADIDFDIQVRSDRRVPLYTLQIHHGKTEGYHINRDLDKLMADILRRI